MRRLVIGLFIAMGFGIAFYAGFVTAAVQKSAFHASFNIILARDMLRATPVSSELRSDARTLLGAAILTLGADRPYVISRATATALTALSTWRARFLPRCQARSGWLSRRRERRRTANGWLTGRVKLLLLLQPPGSVSFPRTVNA